MKFYLEIQIGLELKNKINRIDYIQKTKNFS